MSGKLLGMRLPALKTLFPTWQNVLLALLSCGLLVLAFPPFELWFTAWFALVPLIWAVERENCVRRSFVLGWLFGNVFFFATCWWLTFAPITYAGFPAPLAYFLLFFVTSAAAVFPGVFAAITSLLLKRFGSAAFLAVPFVWVFTEFLRYWLTGNNWNAVGYSQAFSYFEAPGIARVGGIFLVSFYVSAANATFSLVVSIKASGRRGRIRHKMLVNTFVYGLNPLIALFFTFSDPQIRRIYRSKLRLKRLGWHVVGLPVIASAFLLFLSFADLQPTDRRGVLQLDAAAFVVAIQPNVPMAGLDLEKWRALRERHAEMALTAGKPDFTQMIESELSVYSTPEDIDEYRKLYIQLYASRFEKSPTVVIFPESPMNFMYEDDPETQEFINGFAKRNNVSVLFNSAEPDASNGKFFNSAVMVGPDGKEVAQYDKIYLLPFGEAVPFPLEGILPGFVGNFSYGREYDLLPLGDAKAGVMICFESHFGQLSREYVRNGADVIIEMTNDGYLGPTPVLRQHLANAVFRAVETNRPVLRVTNVGITAYISERGQVLDPAESYVEATRVWSVAKSDGSQTFYVKYGDWFAWLCSIVTLGLLIFSFRRKNNQVENSY